MKNNTITELNTEIEKRIEEMEKPGYEFPKKFTRLDYAVTGTVAFICLALIVIGGFLS